MKHFLGVVCVSLLSAATSYAQTSPAGNKWETRWLLDSETGSDAGLGFKEPHVAVGPSFERPIGLRFEVQGSIHYSPDKKSITNDGNSLLVQGVGIFWINGRFGLSGNTLHSNLWTSQFNKSAFRPAAGVVIREHFEGMPGRLYLNFLIPTGCEWGPNYRIQSNRTKGPEVYWEHRLWPNLRLGLHFGVYHILNQSNNFRPDIPRTGEWTGNTHVVLRFEFPSGSLDGNY
jgi:hypothetical protein